MRLRQAFLWLAVLPLCAGNLLACPVCWSGLSHSAEGMRMAGGFQNGIIFLLAVPFLLAGIIGYRIYQAVTAAGKNASRHAPIAMSQQISGTAIEYRQEARA